jgi:hypothetical protein
MKMVVALAKQKFVEITGICVHFYCYFISCALAVTWVPALIVIGTSNHGSIWHKGIELTITGHCNIPLCTFYRIILILAVYFSLDDHFVQYTTSIVSSCATRVAGDDSQVKQAISNRFFPLRIGSYVRSLSGTIKS